MCHLEQQIFGKVGAYEASLRSEAPKWLFNAAYRSDSNEDTRCGGVCVNEDIILLLVS